MRALRKTLRPPAVTLRLRSGQETAKTAEEMHTKNAKEIPVPVPDARTRTIMLPVQNQVGVLFVFAKFFNTKLPYIPELAEIQNDRNNFSLITKQ